MVPDMCLILWRGTWIQSGSGCLLPWYLCCSHPSGQALSDQSSLQLELFADVLDLWLLVSSSNLHSTSNTVKTSQWGWSFCFCTPLILPCCMTQAHGVFSGRVLESSSAGSPMYVMFVDLWNITGAKNSKRSNLTLDFLFVSAWSLVRAPLPCIEQLHFNSEMGVYMFIF